MVLHLLNQLYTYVTYIEEKQVAKIGFLKKYGIISIKKICVYTICFVSYLELYFYSGKHLTMKRDDNIIVSLTSFPARINSVWLTIYSLMKQSINPIEIVLYLSIVEFPNTYNDLPNSLLKLSEKGLKILFVKNNLRSHKKYYYSLQEFPNIDVVTVDDDLYYPPDTLQRLIDISVRFPMTVCANVASEIQIVNGKVTSYVHWKKTDDQFFKHQKLVAIGHGGVFYPKGIRPTQFFDEKLFVELAFHADDLWLKAVEMHNNIDVSVGNYFPHPMVIPTTQKIALKNKNSVGEVLNDIQWSRLSEKLKLKFD